MKYAIVCRNKSDTVTLMQELYEGGCRWINGEPETSHADFFHIRFVYSDGSIAYINNTSLWKQLVFAEEQGFKIISSNYFYNNRNIITKYQKKVEKMVSISGYKLSYSTLVEISGY